MNWILNKKNPICPQLCRIISVAVSSGEYPAGSKLPSVREVALAAGVNPNTVQKSFEELERSRIIYSVRSVGWFVCENTQPADTVIEELIQEKTNDYFQLMHSFGLSTEQIKNTVKEWIE